MTILSKGVCNENQKDHSRSPEGELFFQSTDSEAILHSKIELFGIVGSARKRQLMQTLGNVIGPQHTIGRSIRASTMLNLTHPRQHG